MPKKTTDYKRQFNEDNYDRIYVSAPKGKKEEYKALAERNGMSLNALIIELLEQKVKGQWYTAPFAPTFAPTYLYNSLPYNCWNSTKQDIKHCNIQRNSEIFLKYIDIRNNSDYNKNIAKSRKNSE